MGVTGESKKEVVAAPPAENVKMPEVSESQNAKPVATPQAKKLEEVVEKEETQKLPSKTSKRKPLDAEGIEGKEFSGSEVEARFVSLMHVTFVTRRRPSLYLVSSS